METALPDNCKLFGLAVVEDVAQTGTTPDSKPEQEQTSS